MIKIITIAIAASGLLFLAASFDATVRAQATSMADGVYSEAQAKRGATLYTEQCASCHGETLEGVPGALPALKGETFAQNWTGKTVGDLYTKIVETMPVLAPGSLKPDQTSDLVAHILSVSKYPAGSMDLPADADQLKQIKIDAPK